MANYVLLSHGGSMPEGPEAGAKFMRAWMDWFDQAVAIARGCPVLQGGSTLQVVETYATM